MRDSNQKLKLNYKWQCPYGPFFACHGKKAFSLFTFAPHKLRSRSLTGGSFAAYISHGRTATLHLRGSLADLYQKLSSNYFYTSRRHRAHLWP